MFSSQKIIKKLIFNKTKNTSVRFFIYMSSGCVHCIWRSGFEVICILVSALKSNMAAISMETNRGKKKFWDFFSIFFHTDHNEYIRWNDWVEKKVK